MELVQIEVICSQPLQRPLKLCLRLLLVPGTRLAGEKGAVSIWLQCRLEALLGTAVRRRDIVVVDPSVERFRDDPVCRFLFHTVHDDAAEAHNRELLSSVSKESLFHYPP